jgi:hypothetical protein
VWFSVLRSESFTFQYILVHGIVLNTSKYSIIVSGCHAHGGYLRPASPVNLPRLLFKRSEASKSWVGKCVRIHSGRFDGDLEP